MVAPASRSVRARLGPDAQRVDIAGFGSARVVGVVDDVKYDGLTETAKPAVYVPWQQSPPALPGALVIETDGPSASFVASIREQLARERADFAVADVRPLADVFGESALEQRLQMILLVAFAVVASVVCSAGVIGVTGFTVNAGFRKSASVSPSARRRPGRSRS